MRQLQDGFLCTGRDLYDEKYEILNDHVTV